MKLTAWWSELTLALQIFYGIGALSLAFLLLQALLSFAGLAVETQDPTAFDAERSSGLGVISVRTLTAFFVGFGWTGVLAQKNGLALLPTIILACGVGTALMFGIYFLMLSMLKLQSSGTLDYRNAIGEVATVYVTIPGRGAGAGQVEVAIQGQNRIVTAMNADADPLPPQSKVKVVGLVDRSTLSVERL